MQSKRIQQAPGWWPGLVQAACDDCGWKGPVRDLGQGAQMEVLARLDRDEHECGK
jgi:hypothetical protein